MKKEDLQKIADLLAHVYIPALVKHATALESNAVLQEIGRLQEVLRHEIKQHDGDG